MQQGSRRVSVLPIPPSNMLYNSQFIVKLLFPLELITKCNPQIGTDYDVPLSQSPIEGASGLHGGLHRSHRRPPLSNMQIPLQYTIRAQVRNRVSHN